MVKVSYFGEQAGVARPIAPKGLGREDNEKALDHQKGNNLDRVVLPEEGYGICRIWYNSSKTKRNHTSDELILANGICVSCWDGGLGGQLTYNQRSLAKLGDKRLKANRT